MQQGLGGDAAHVQADAAEVGVALYQDGLEAEVRRAEGRRIAARPGAQHDYIGVIFAVAGRGRGGWRGEGRGFDRRLWRRRGWGLSRRAGRLGWIRREPQDQRAFRDLLPALNAKFGDLTRRRRGNVHRGLVAFQREQGLFRLDPVAGADQDFDDLHALEIANVRNEDVSAHVYNSSWRISPSRPPRQRLNSAPATPSITR